MPGLGWDAGGEMTVARPGEGQAGSLEALDAEAADIIIHGHPATLAAKLPELLACGLDGHPWAATVLAAALHDVSRGDPRVEALLDDAGVGFETGGDRRGTGFVSFLRGNVALAAGEIHEACQYWEQARSALQGGVPTDEALVLAFGLEAYQAGRLWDAVALAEEGLALARIRGAAIQEGSASVFVAFFLVSCGDLARADTVIEVALRLLYSSLPPDEQRDVPLLEAGRGVIASLRGDPETADAAFSFALRTAERLGLVWQGAIAQCLRAEFTAGYAAQRSVADARTALATFESLGERWWRTSALRGLAAASLQMGENGAAATTLDRLLAEDLAPSERARTLLVLGNARLQSGDLVGARSALAESEDIHRDLGLRYWHAQSMVLLARAEPARSANWYRKALTLDDGDQAYRVLLAGSSQLQVNVLGDAAVAVDGVDCRFATQNAQRALFGLALAAKGCLHSEALAERLWGDVPPKRLGGRVRTLLWQVRQALTYRHAWRVTLSGGVVRLDLRGVVVDAVAALHDAQRLLDVRDPSAGHSRADAARVSETLRLPLLPAFQYEEWVQDHRSHMQRLADRLEDHYEM